MHEAKWFSIFLQDTEPARAIRRIGWFINTSCNL